MSYAADNTIAWQPMGTGNVVALLLGEALALIEQDKTTALNRIEHAIAVAQFRGNDAPPQKGTLANWQTRRVTEYIRNNISTKLRVEDVAKVAKLGEDYFPRAFKATFGMSYSRYVSQARIDMAMHLMLTTQAPISEIALDCGMADQSHLTRQFSRSVGRPPCAWRRQMLNGDDTQQQSSCEQIDRFGT